MKYSNPFKTGSVYISQTYHSGGDNKYAIDLGSKPAESPVYAIADGVIDATNSKAGSYCRLAVDNSDQKVYYVHVYKYLPQGTRVKKGDKICEIAPKSLNGGYAPHLHLGLQGSYKIIDYFDRDIVFRTQYPGITKDWFKNGSFNWDLHKDLSYSNEPELKKGDKLEMTNKMNVRNRNLEDIGDASKGSVCEVQSFYKVSSGYDYYNVAFGDLNCYIADTGFNKKTSKDVTNLDGSKVVSECDALQKQVDTLKKQNEVLDASIEVLQKQVDSKNVTILELEGYKEFYEGLSEYVELKNIPE